MASARLRWSTILTICAFLIGLTSNVAFAGTVDPADPPAASNATSGTVVPPIHVVTDRSGIAPGVLFANPAPAFGTSPAWTGGPMIYDNAGHVIWYLPNANVHVTLPVTYKKQRAVALHVTTGFAGGWTVGHWVILNQQYQQIGTIGNGVDHHELLLTNNGTIAYVDSYHSVPYDLSKYGGPVNGTVVEAVIQKIDVMTDKVLFEWHSLAQVPVTATYESLKDSPVDYFHLNSISLDTDGNLIVSGRSISAVLKLNRNSGAVIWQLGGRESTFHFVNDGGPSWQHDARALGDNRYSIFDNGVSRKPQYSRGVIYKIDPDPKKRTATVVAQWRHTPDLYSGIEGSNRRLSNGDELIGWAVNGIATEYSGHTVVFESKFDGATSYRTLRSVWNATPRTPPSLAVRRDGGTITAQAAWNGATGIIRWELLGGPDAHHLTILRNVRYTGFQMTQTMNVPSNARVFAVRAVRGGAATEQSTVTAAR